MTSTETTSPQADTDSDRWKYGLIAVALGVSALVLAALILLWLHRYTRRRGPVVPG